MVIGLVHDLLGLKMSLETLLLVHLCLAWYSLLIVVGFVKIRLDIWPIWIFRNLDD